MGAKSVKNKHFIRWTNLLFTISLGAKMSEFKSKERLSEEIKKVRCLVP